VSTFECPECGYTFNEAVGDQHEGYPPGTAFDALPEEFVCPDCSIQIKQDFIKQ
jgi:rubredoxin